MDSILNRLQQSDIKEIFKQKNIDHVYLFGSYARGTAKQKSDIDLLYKESGDEKFSLFDLMQLKVLLEEKLLTKVDLVNLSSVNKHFKDTIDKEKLLIF